MSQEAAESVRLALEFTILCATRTSETLLATWNEIDLESKTWTIPGARMKAGVEHRVPLSIEVFKRAKVLSSGGLYLFEGRNAKRPLSNMAFLMTLRRMKRDDVTPHGFRSTFRDWAAERTNFSRAICEAVLAHTLRDKTEAAYNRTDLFDSTLCRGRNTRRFRNRRNPRRRRCSRTFQRSSYDEAEGAAPICGERPRMRELVRKVNQLLGDQARTLDERLSLVEWSACISCLGNEMAALQLGECH